MSNRYDVLVVGAGVFGLTAVIELSTRGYRTAVLDPGPIPHPLAASNDISKAVRLPYGADETYTAMMEEALPLWQEWNQDLGETVYHGVGTTMLTRQPMAPGGFEYESFHLLSQRGHRPERLNGDDIARRFPAWKPGEFVDGFFLQESGYAESGLVVALLAEWAEAAGVDLLPGETVTEWVEGDGRVSGVRTKEGSVYAADHVVVAAGAWTPFLVPALAPFMKTTGHPVFHLKLDDPLAFTPPHLTVFAADVTETGWYGFPYHPKSHVLKVANHGVGRQLHPTLDQRVVTDADIRQLRNFLSDTFPSISRAPIVYTRRCLYNDTLDEHLWMDHHPQLQGLSVAAGGSGHGFKFAPLLGPMIADMVEKKSNPWLPKFRWRHLEPDTTGEEASRYHG